MPMAKKGTTPTAAEAPAAPVTTTAAPAASPAAVQSAAPADSGTQAAISRLQKKTETTQVKNADKYAGRDFDKEAHGKTRCAMYAAALMSPALAGAKWDNVEQYLALCKQAADSGTAYTFGDKN